MKNANIFEVSERMNTTFEGEWWTITLLNEIGER
jgi:hypothetical protein